MLLRVGPRVIEVRCINYGFAINKRTYINTRGALNRISWRKIYDKVLGAGRVRI